MTRGKIRLSPKHGVNPAIPRCYYCCEAKSELVLAGRLPDDMESPQVAAWDMEPCDKCRDLMKLGMFVIAIEDGESDRMADEQDAHKSRYAHLDVQNVPTYIPNPRRMGGWWVLKRDAFEQALSAICENPASIKRMLKNGWCFLDDQVCKLIGLDPVNPTKLLNTSEEQSNGT